MAPDIDPPSDLDTGRHDDQDNDTRQAPHPPSTPGVPPAVAQRYLRVDHKYYFPDKTLAFTDVGHELRAKTNNAEVARSLVTIAQARGWTAIRVKGAPEFRRQIWREARLRGLRVDGYRPSEVEQAELRQTRQRRRAPDRAERDAAAPTPADNAAPAIPPTAPPTPESPSRLTGELLEHGAAPYQFEPKARLSYFVKLRTRHGERTLWGVDLERALVESQTGVGIGDTATIENLGARPTQVKVTHQDEAGRPVGERWIQAHRNTWVIESPAWFEARARQAAAFRASEQASADLLAQHPELAPAVLGRWLGERFAQARVDDPGSRERLVAAIHERLGEAIERGETIPMPSPHHAPTPNRKAPDPAPVRARHARVPDPDLQPPHVPG